MVFKQLYTHIFFALFLISGTVIGFNHQAQQKQQFYNFEVPAEADGHFRITAYINQKPLRMLVDTGASMMAISRNDAKRLGFNHLDRDFKNQGSSASGKINFVEIKIPALRLGDKTFYNVPTAVLNIQEGTPLLGMNILSQIRKIEISKEKLTLTY